MASKNGCAQKCLAKSLLFFTYKLVNTLSEVHLTHSQEQWNRNLLAGTILALPAMLVSVGWQVSQQVGTP